VDEHHDSEEAYDAGIQTHGGSCQSCGAAAPGAAAAYPSWASPLRIEGAGM
jgi:hypothetical protein